MSREEQKIIDYMVVCIDEFADTFNLNYKEAFNYLKKYDAIKFLRDNYEIEHTLSIEDAVEDLYQVTLNHGGTLI